MKALGWVIAGGVGLGIVLVGRIAMAKSAATSTPSRDVPVVDEDGRPIKMMAAWHSTPDQTQMFGPRFPELYTLDEGGLFLYRNIGGLETGQPFAAYRPNWAVQMRMT
jgi:hypothetical protein